MCIGNSRKSTPDAAKPIVASTESPEALRAANLAERIRRRRAGAAANILTSQLGVPYEPGMAQTGDAA